MVSSCCRCMMFVDFLIVYLDVSSMLILIGNLYIEVYGSYCFVLILLFFLVLLLMMFYIDFDVCLCCNCRGRVK